MLSLSHDTISSAPNKSKGLKAKNAGLQDQIKQHEGSTTDKINTFNGTSYYENL
jgi:hypothetical protein